MASSTISSLLFLLILMFSLYMDETVDAQTETRKLKETMKMRRNLKDNDERSSKMFVPGSRTLHCQGPKSFKNMKKNTYHHILGRDSSFPFSDCFPFSCISCNPFSGANCYSARCVTTRTCDEDDNCTTSEECTPASGD